MTFRRCLPLRLMVRPDSMASSVAPVQEDIGESQDCRHRGSILMAHVRQEFALGPVSSFGLIRLFEPLIGLL